MFWLMPRRRFATGELDANGVGKAGFSFIRARKAYRTKSNCRWEMDVAMANGDGIKNTFESV